MTLVGEVAGVDLKPPRTGLVADHGVEQRVVGRTEDIGAVPGLTDVAHATADGDARQAERRKTIFRPQRGLMLRHGFDTLAGVVAAFDARIDIGVGADQIEVRRHAGDHFEFGAADSHLAGLDREQGIVGVGRQPVLFDGVVDRPVDRRARHRIVLEAELHHLALLGLADRGADAAAEDRVE